ncbi:MAG: hypothetical protein SPH02_00400 [Campylobacter sp.]|uniref:hypothetical protein n=1 Tax=Campylobacter sp. TaxID=205 RepID=UPI002A98F3C0|nr:hypothetical protein [Campylobacter sp.]MCI7075649.1 hypothetical protein [Campylobacter sp.]MDY5303372.1 hypothetical protein [Campylobacter sp.]
MIFYSDGIFPLWGFIIIFIVFYALRKEAKRNKIMDKKIQTSKNKADEFDKLLELVYSGEKMIKKSDFKHLRDADFSHFHGRGIKFI